jgi:hypothetical protein
LQLELWSRAAEQARGDPNAVTSGLYLQALNAMIDAYGTRNAALDRHVPELVLFLLFGTFLITGSIVGYASGTDRHRSSLVTYLMVALIVVLVFLIIDLDRPRRGLIGVSHASLVELATGIAAEQAGAEPGGD